MDQTVQLCMKSFSGEADLLSRLNRDAADATDPGGFPEASTRVSAWESAGNDTPPAGAAGF